MPANLAIFAAGPGDTCSLSKESWRRRTNAAFWWTRPPKSMRWSRKLSPRLGKCRCVLLINLFRHVRLCVFGRLWFTILFTLILFYKLKEGSLVIEFGKHQHLDDLLSIKPYTNLCACTRTECVRGDRYPIKAQDWFCGHESQCSVPAWICRTPGYPTHQLHGQGLGLQDDLHHQLLSGTVAEYFNRYRYNR